MAQTSVVVPEVGMAAAACPCPGPLFPYPPPRAGAGMAVRRKCLRAAQAELGAGLLNGLVESMRASSPTHARAAAALAAGVDEEHAAWMARHPSALGKFEEIVAASKGKQIVMFLDYDGTLSPIVNDPDAAFMSDTMRMAVRSVAKQFPTAIVSGRCRDKVFEFVKLAELYYAGSHGMDIKGPAKSSAGHAKSNKAKGVLFQPASEFLPMIEQVHQRLIDETRDVPGAKVENNKFCVSVHFRNVDEKLVGRLVRPNQFPKHDDNDGACLLQGWAALAETVKSVVREYPKLRVTQGRMVFEVRPTIKWDKGKALEFLLESLGYADCADVLPVYIGDDRTDEDAFKALRRRGQGIGILVSKHPKETSASFSLQEPAEVMEFLLRLVEWKQLAKARLRLRRRADAAAPTA
ncbi:hypothetical protein ACQ4PT_033614 [Festuca glaucescens]